MSAAARSAILCRSIIAVLRDVPEDEPGVDLLDLKWDEMESAALQRTTRKGKPLRILLPAGQKLQHGAVLVQDGNQRVVANLLACKVLSVKFSSKLELAKTAYSLGNLHLPTQITSDEIFVPAEPAYEAALAHLGIDYKIQNRRFTPERSSLPRITVKLKSQSPK